MYEDAVAGTFFVSGESSLIRLRYGGPGGLYYLHEVRTGPNDQCASHRLDKGGPKKGAMSGLKELATDMKKQKKRNARKAFRFLIEPLNP